MEGFRLNKKQHDKLYDLMMELYPEVCACCKKTKHQLEITQLKIHHTRYDVDPKDAQYTRFLCNSCQQDPSLKVDVIRNENLKHPLEKYPEPTDPASPRTFQKGERTAKLLREYLPRRLCEESENTGNPNPKLRWEDFRNDASEYCGCLPKAIDQQIQAQRSRQY